MRQNPFVALWVDWIEDPARDLLRSVGGAIRFTFQNLAYLPAFVRRHILSPPRIHMFPERLYVLISTIAQANLLLVLLVGLVIGRMLSGGLALLPLQQLAYLYALRAPLLALTFDHLLPATITLMLIARAGTGIAVRTTLGRARGIWPSLDDPDPARRARAFDQLVLPRALAIGLTGGMLGLAAQLALATGFALEPGAMRFASSLPAFFAGLETFLELTGWERAGLSLLKCAFMGTAVGFVACYEGLRGSSGLFDAYRVVGRAFRSTLAAWAITDVWMTLLFRAVQHG